MKILNIGYEPKTTVREGIPVFAKWHREYHGLHDFPSANRARI